MILPLQMNQTPFDAFKACSPICFPSPLSYKCCSKRKATEICVGLHRYQSSRPLKPCHFFRFEIWTGYRLYLTIGQPEGTEGRQGLLRATCCMSNPSRVRHCPSLPRCRSDTKWMATVREGVKKEMLALTLGRITINHDVASGSGQLCVVRCRPPRIEKANWLKELYRVIAGWLRHGGKQGKVLQHIVQLAKNSRIRSERIMPMLPSMPVTKPTMN